MDISSIIYAALGGGLGAGLGGVMALALGRSQTSKSILGAGLTAVLAVLGFTVTGALYKNMTLPRIVPMDTATLDASVSYLKYIRAEDPDTYAELVRPIDEATRNNKVTQDTINEFRATLTRVLDAKKREASAGSLRGEYAAAVDLYKILKESAPVVCTQKLHGRPFQNLSDFLNEDYTKKEQRAMSAFFTNPPRDRDFTVDVQQGEKIFNALLQETLELLEITNIDPSVTDTTVENVADHKKICDFHIKFNNDLMAMEDAALINTSQFLALQ